MRNEILEHLELYFVIEEPTLLQMSNNQSQRYWKYARQGFIGVAFLYFIRYTILDVHEKIQANRTPWNVEQQAVLKEVEKAKEETQLEQLINNFTPFQNSPSGQFSKKQY
eukprot:TRINITY_DN718_c1_g2_i1.p6 TRINITY_DN718_c1_g2~~TRINITY_DN718_c1_g2_i1.p6  ORF type:complete len:110 (-),score=12.87 TRINITY_DN718_c1_g2_i1:668-997(-)